jgi:tRNA(Ile)-lysidine synthase
MSGSLVERLQAAVSDGLPAHERTLVAVSGGVDSMVLLHAAAAVREPRQLVVATFDHASGPHSAAAVELVQRVAMSAGIPVIVGRGESIERPSEASWRDARLAFLRAAAAETSAVICMAHTFDDQVETVLFREIRGAGTRGLAGLAVSGSILRPLLGFRRAEIADYARATGVEWVDDPTNVDRAFTRNRLRHDVIPALRDARPSIEAELADLGDRAAQWRVQVEAAVDERIQFEADPAAGILEVSRESLAGYPDDVLAIIWPALLGRIGLAADWRGTRRLVAFTTRGSTGQRIQLSGGWTVYRRRRGFEVCRDGRTRL